MLLSQIDQHFLEVGIAELDDLLLILCNDCSVFLIEEILQSIELEQCLLWIETTEAILITFAFVLYLIPHLRILLLQSFLLNLVLKEEW